MKKLCISLLLLVVVTSANAQIIKGDMNDDKTLTMTDANAVVNTFVNGKEPQVIDVVTREEYNEHDKQIQELQRLVKELSDRLAALEGGSTDPYNGHEYVDLGLSVKWATCNVGATKPGEDGDYFAWGEVEPKESYTWENYKWCEGTSTSQTKYVLFDYYGTVDNKSVLEPEDDAAHVNWGGAWRMPTHQEQQELLNDCIWTWSYDDGYGYGYIVTGPNGNFIFLPTSGEKYGTYFADDGDGNYWSSSLLDEFTNWGSYSWFMGFRYRGNMHDVGQTYRQYGLTVRAVCP